MNANDLYAPEMAWQEFSEFPGTAEVKFLRDEGRGKARTMLIRLHAGGKVTPHAHVAPVQHYILEGEYESEGRICGAGTYRLLPGHADVGDISTQNGVTILMVYDPVA
jgi:hypothetical protein